MLRLGFRLFSAAIALLAVLFLATPVHADTFFTAQLTNSQENPPTIPTLSSGGSRPVSFGTATFVLNDAMTSLTFSASVFNIDFTGSQTPDVNDNLIAAHIHAGPLVTPTTNGGVVWGFFGLPFNDVPNEIVNVPFINMVGGMISGKWDAAEGNNTTLALQLDHILNGRAYINFHTTQFGGGEIRGAIVSAPEPSSVILLFAGLSGLVGLSRRLKQ